jgi:hypothetical protein
MMPAIQRLWISGAESFLGAQAAAAAQLEPAHAAVVCAIHVGDEIADQGFVSAKVAVLQAEHDHFAQRVELNARAGLIEAAEGEQAAQV